jgi:hypothetical protein
MRSAAGDALRSTLSRTGDALLTGEWRLRLTPHPPHCVHRTLRARPKPISHRPLPLQTPRPAGTVPPIELENLLLLGATRSRTAPFPAAAIASGKPPHPTPPPRRHRLLALGFPILIPRRCAVLCCAMTQCLWPRTVC